MGTLQLTTFKGQLDAVPLHKTTFAALAAAVKKKRAGEWIS